MFGSSTKQDWRLQFNAIIEKFFKNWYDKFKDTSSVRDCKRTGRPSSSDDTIDAVHTAIQFGRRKSTCRASIIKGTTEYCCHDFLQTPTLATYKVQIVQAMQPNKLCWSNS